MYYFWVAPIQFFLSESGFSGLKDKQD